MAYRIEPASITHIPWLRMLYIRWTAEAPFEYPTIDNEEYDNFTISLLRQINENPDFGCLVAMIGRRIVGFLAGEIINRAIGKPHRYFQAHWMYVVPKHRTKGVAKQLIAAGLHWLAERDVQYVELTEQVKMADGEWTRRGFSPFLIHYFVPADRIAALLPAALHGNGKIKEMH